MKYSMIITFILIKLLYAVEHFKSSLHQYLILLPSDQNYIYILVLHIQNMEYN